MKKKEEGVGDELNTRVDGDRNVKDYTWFGVDKYLFFILWSLSCWACFVEPFGVWVCVYVRAKERERKKECVTATML